MLCALSGFGNFGKVGVDYISLTSHLLLMSQAEHCSVIIMYGLLSTILKFVAVLIQKVVFRRFRNKIHDYILYAWTRQIYGPTFARTPQTCSYFVGEAGQEPRREVGRGGTEVLEAVQPSRRVVLSDRQ